MGWTRLRFVRPKETKSLAIAKASMRDEGRLNSNSRRIAGFKLAMEKLMRRGSEILVTLFMRSSTRNNHSLGSNPSKWGTSSFKAR